jgi:hypothetical protein
VKPLKKKIIKHKGEEYLLPSYSLITGETFDYDQEVVDKWLAVYKNKGN